MPSVAGCKTFLRRVDPGSARLTWKCLLRIPHSFAAGDNLSFCIERESETQDEADENACRQAFAHLMLADASQVVFRPKHWTIPIEDVVAGLPLRPGVHQALPVHFRRMSALSSEAIAMGCMLEPDDRDQGLAAELVRGFLMAHGGSFDPSRISHKAMCLVVGDERTYSKFKKLFAPGALKVFIERSTEFEWNRVGSNGMVVTWSHAYWDAMAIASTVPSRYARGSASEWLDGLSFNPPGSAAPVSATTDDAGMT